MDENSSRWNKRAKKLSVKEKKTMAEIVSTYVVAVDRNGDARANIQLPTSPTPHYDSVCHVRPQTRSPALTTDT